MNQIVKQALLVLGLVMVFGFSAFTTGAFQFFTGKRSRLLIWLMLGLGFVLWLITSVITIFF